MTAKFIQLHTLTNYSASLLNRDDAGFAKRMPFGGETRTRISSQCLKRHWRTYAGENGLNTIKDAPESVRSRVSFDRFIVEPLVAEGIDRELARSAAERIVGRVLGSEQKKEKAEKKKGSDKKAEKKSEEGAAEESGPVSTAQVTVLGRPELDYLCQLAREAIKAAGRSGAGLDKALDEKLKDEKALKSNLKALMPGSLEAGLGAALFGRMVTGDVLSRTDAAIHVAHALTVHSQHSESDYFSAIDDLLSNEGEQGSGHINASELTSGLFYGYVVIDVEGLVSNLGGDHEMAAQVVRCFTHMVATVSPGAKKGSTAPYAYSHLVLAEAGNAQPRTLQNAFVHAVSARGDLIDNAYAAMKQHLDELDKMYGKSERRAHSGLRSEKHFENFMSMPRLAEWAMAEVRK